MDGAITRSLACLSLFLCVSNTALAQDNTTNGAVFVHQQSPNEAPFVFALNAYHDGDLYFHMSGPAGNSWMAVGIGAEMADALMFIGCNTGHGKTLLSPRVALNGESEPTYYPHVKCEMLDTDDANTTANAMSFNAVCHNATSWHGGSLDKTSSSQPWTFAYGPKGTMEDSMSAGMARHEYYGDFMMDMMIASSQDEARVPRPNGSNSTYLSQGTSDGNDVQRDNDKFPLIHAAVMCIAFIGIFPAGSLILRVAHRVMMHAWCQVLGLVFVIVGSGTGAVISVQYSRSRKFNSAHQAIGIIILIAMIAQLALGWVHHIIFKRTRLPTVLGRIHLFMGPTAIVVGLVNGGLGFDLALASRGTIIAYALVALVFGVIFLLIRVIYPLVVKRREQRQLVPEAHGLSSLLPGASDTMLPLTSRESVVAGNKGSR